METFKAVCIGIITLGMVIPMPVSSNISLSVAIVDREEGRVIYYDKSSIDDNPLDENVMNRQLQKVFKAFLK